MKAAGEKWLINRKQKFKLLAPSYEKLWRPKDSGITFFKSEGGANIVSPEISEEQKYPSKMKVQ